MLERAQLRNEIAVSVSAMTIDQHRIEAGASRMFNMVEGFEEVTGYINRPRVHLFSSFLVLPNIHPNSYYAICLPINLSPTQSIYVLPTYPTQSFLPPSPNHLTSISPIYFSPSLNCRPRSINPPTFEYEISSLCLWLGRNLFLPPTNNKSFAHIRPNNSPIHPIPQSNRQIC